MVGNTNETMQNTDVSLEEPTASVLIPKKTPNDKTTIGPGRIDYLQNITTAELSMIHRLAGNDPEIRKTTMKKLRKWLKSIAHKVSNNLESKSTLESNFGRIWKALFYCMWMADKPLPQEALAEQISNLVSVFTPNPTIMMAFVEWFLITFIREWRGIDRFRLDKFMMLIRRFLRKVLQNIKKTEWSDSYVDPFLNLLIVYVFNHHPKIPKSQRRISNLAPIPISPFGFQIHVIDIFMEELSKVGGNTLTGEQILKLLSPFIREVAENDDERILDEIKERIFHHLMKQSDAGIDYAESRFGTLEFVETDSEDEEPGEEHHLPIQNGSLDPRAGAVDVVLPQLKLDYTALVLELDNLASRKDIRAKNRKILSLMSRQFDELGKGIYPLRINLHIQHGRIIKESTKQAAVKSLIEMEQSVIGPKVKRMNKKQRKLAAKRRIMNRTQDVDAIEVKEGEEVDGSNGADENEVGLTEEGNIEVSMDITDTTDSVPTISEMTPMQKLKMSESVNLSEKIELTKPLRRKRKAKSLGSSLPNSPKSLPTEVAKSEEPTDGLECSSKEASKETYIVVKRRRLSESNLSNGLSAHQVKNLYSPLVSASSMGRLTMSETKSIGTTKAEVILKGKGRNASASSGSEKKKVNFVLNRNMEHREFI